MVAAGELGEVRVVQIEYAQDWFTERVDAPTAAVRACHQLR